MLYMFITIYREYTIRFIQLLHQGIDFTVYLKTIRSQK